jgi:hypothetical protein
MTTSSRRLYAAVALCAVVVQLGALWNQFALDDQIVIVLNPLVARISGLWQAFTLPYWPPELRAQMYRPLTMATFVLDRAVDGAAWFHAVNLAWHAGATVAVTALARRWSGSTAALVAGLVFAVHPVHVEAVANVVGRAELMAALFALLAVYAAVERQSVGWSAAALALGILSKENAAVTPALIAWVWILGVRPLPPRRRLLAFAATWVVLAVAYAAVRWAVLQPYGVSHGVAPTFRDAAPIDVRLTAVAILSDVGRLLVFPYTLRIDYAPAERTLVTSLFDPRFGLGLVCFAVWAGLLVWAVRAGRRVEAVGLGWIAIAFLPVANLLFPSGISLAERTLYLPSAGLAIAAGAWLRALDGRRLALVLGAVVLAGAARTAVRVPVWRDDMSVTLSILEDSPRSYRGPARAAGVYQGRRQAGKAREAYLAAIAMYDKEPALFVGAAASAFTVGRAAEADSLLAQTVPRCGACAQEYAFQITIARWLGDSGVADSLAAHQRAQAAAARVER